MTQEAILTLTKDSGFTQVHQRGVFMCSLSELVAFADSIKSKTREECVKVVEQEIKYGTANEYLNHNMVIAGIATKIRSGT